MLRNVLALVAGLVVSIGVVKVVEMIGHTIWPPPADLDWTDGDAIRTYTSQQPFLALLFPILSYFLGTIAGPLIACRIGTARPLLFVGVIGIVMLAATIATLIWIPHPIWFSVLAIGAVIIGGWLALQLGSRRTGEPAA